MLKHVYNKDKSADLKAHLKAIRCNETIQRGLFCAFVVFFRWWLLLVRWLEASCKHKVSVFMGSCAFVAYIYVFRHTVGFHGGQQLHDGDDLQAQH